MASALVSTTTTTESAARPQQIQTFLLIWVDANARSSTLDTQETLKHLRTIVNDVKLVDQPDECLHILEQMPNKQSFVITSGFFGKELVPRIHDIAGLDAIYIFCGNKQYHEQWSRVWRKVRAVETDIELIGEALKMAVKQCNQDDIAMSIIDIGDGSDIDLNRLEPSFLYSSLLKNAILNMDHDLEEEMAIFKTNALQKSAEKHIDEKILDEFQTGYRSDQAILWYTKETFLYPLMNGALRNLEGDIIVDMGFFIHDLHRQLETLHQTQLTAFGSRPFVVYRGQGLTKEKFEQLNKSKGGLLGFNNFLSTSRNRSVSLDFAKWSADKPENVGILFVMTIDPKLKLTPFADVEGHTAVKGEEEILFSMHTIFRISEIKQLSGTSELYEIQLVLTNEDDPQMKKLHNYMQNSKKVTGWHRIGWILQDMNQLEKSEEIYKRLLAQETNEVDQGTWNHQLGVIKWRLGDYPTAKPYYEKALEIKMKVFSGDDPALATTYSALGSVYSDMGNYHQALSNYERALEIEKKTLPDKHSSLATSYLCIGVLYYRMEKYRTALEYLEKALRIYEASLPSNHPDIASAHEWIAITNKEMNE